jgi:hypothetical protein
MPGIGGRSFTMRINQAIWLGVLVSTMAVRADVIIKGFVPPAGPPYYTETGRLEDGSPYFFHDDQWAAFVFVRDPGCVPPTFNLLNQIDVPAAFGCPLTVDGHAILKQAGDQVPVQINLHGLGAVPVWFVKLSEVQTILAGNTLSVSQLLASPSLRRGFAQIYEEVDLPGPFRPQGAGNGSIEITASGLLTDGTSFQFEWRDMGKKDGNGQDFVRHVRIAFN